MSSESDVTDGAAVRFPPPFVPVVAIAIGVALEVWLIPLAIPMSAVVRFGLGGAAIVAGLALMAAAFGLFRKTGQDPKPWLATPEIISTGVYAHTRNPMYVSMGLLQAGVGLTLVNLWVVFLVPATWLTIYLIAIRHEEAYLTRKFGNAYADYKNKVRRWL